MSSQTASARAAGLWAVVAAACAATGARAQQAGDNLVAPELPIEYDRGRNTSVLDRPRPEYDAIGVQMGGFTLYPRVETSVGYTDNVYQAAAPKLDDLFVSIAPSVRLVSNWSVHQFGLNAGLNVQRYLNESSRNQTGWNLGANGRYDVSGELNFAGSVETRRATEPGTSSTYPTAAAKASQYQSTTAQISGAYGAGRLRLQLGYTLGAFSFDDVTTFSGTRIDQSNRDLTSHGGTVRIEYALTPDASLFTQGNFERNDYRRDLLPGVANRDSDSFRGVAGASFDISGKVRGALAAGYMQRSYDSARYRSIKGFTAEARLEVFASELTTLNISARRNIRDATFVNAGGTTSTDVAFRVDHELLRNLLLDAQAGYRREDFKGIQGAFDVYRVSAGARYIANRTFGFGLSVGRDYRKATDLGIGLSYGETRVLLSIAIQR